MLASPRMSDVAQLATVLEAGITDLVRAAPDLAAPAVEAEAQRALHVALLLVTTAPAATALALAIERTLDGIADGVIAQAVGLPALAMAAYTLGRGVTGGGPVAPLDASRFELETLFPIAGRAAAGPKVDVALDRLSPTLAAAGTAAARARAQRLTSLAVDAITVDESTLFAVERMRRRYDLATP